MGDDGGAPMQLGHGTQIDGKSQHDLLPLAQTQVGGFDEHARSAQIHGLTELPASTRNGDVDNGPGSMPRVQAAFHFEISLAWFY
jgi:hypothetical protein